MDWNSMNFCASIYPACGHHSESLCVKSGEIFRAENQKTSMRGDDEILRTCSVHMFSSCCYSSPKSSTWLNFHSLEFSLLTHTNSSLPPQITCLPRFNSFFFSLLLLSFHCFTRKDDGKKKKEMLRQKKARATRPERVNCGAQLDGWREKWAFFSW